MKRFLKFLYVVGSVSAVGILGIRVGRGDTAELDRKITIRLQTVTDPRFDRAMRIVSWPGFPPQSRIIPWLIPGSMLAVGRNLEAVFQLLGWGTGAISGLVKKLVGRPRPAGDDIVVTEANIGGSSFPSGHVIIYTGVYGFLAYLAFIFIPFTWIRRLVVGGLAALITLVGPSRVYLGHHWFSDVIASYLLGTSYLVVLTSMYQRVRKKRN